MKVIWTILGILWLIQAIFALASGCPPAPFTHKCLMEKADVTSAF